MQEQPIKELPLAVDNDLVKQIIQRVISDTGVDISNPGGIEENWVVTGWRNAVLRCIRKAWSDPAYRAQLLCNDPAVVRLALEEGTDQQYRITDDFDIRFVLDETALWDNANNKYIPNSLRKITVEIPVPVTPFTVPIGGARPANFTEADEDNAHQQLGDRLTKHLGILGAGTC